MEKLPLPDVHSFSFPGHSYRAPRASVCAGAGFCDSVSAYRRRNVTAARGLVRALSCVKGYSRGDDL